MIFNFFSTTYLFRRYFIKGGKKIILTIDIFSTNLELKHDVSHHMDFPYFSWEGGCSLPDHPWVKVLNSHIWIKIATDIKIHCRNPDEKHIEHTL